MISIKRGRVSVSGSAQVTQLPTPIIALVSKTDTEAVLSIAAITGANNYVWYKNGVQVQSSGSTTLSLSGLAASTDYTITCKAQGGAGYTDSALGSYLLRTEDAVAPVGVVGLQIQMSDATGADTTIPELKFNKQGAVVLDFDDSALCSIDSNTKMAGVTYSDGCGNNIPYTAGVALNGRSQFDNELVGYSGANARFNITFAQQRQLIDAGWDMLNHSYYHDRDGNQTGDPRWGYGTDNERNVRELEELILQQINYQIHAGVVPNADAGFQDLFSSRGYITGDSQGTFDEFPVWDRYFWPLRFINLPNDWDFIVQKRDFNTDSMASGGIYTQRLNDLITYMNANPNERCQIALGTHQFYNSEQTAFNSFIDAIESDGGDRVIVTGLAQFWEYQRLRRIQKTETISGNNLNVSLDYTTIPNVDKYSWHDLSFIVGGTGTITGVTCDDSRFAVTFNPSTRLINIRYRKTNF